MNCYPTITDTPVGSTLTESTTSYNAIGKVAISTDELGRTTEYHYDLKGNLVETVNPDGTVSRTVYDVLGRAILTTDRFDPSSSAPVQATRTIYNSLGQLRHVGHSHRHARSRDVCRSKRQR